MMTDKIKVTPVILSGGSGTRLWPMSRTAFPKQFLPLSSENTLIQSAALLVNKEPYTKPIIVSNEDHRFIVAEQLRQIGCEPAAILLEPVGRNTAPAVAIAALQAEALGHDLILVMPSDHVILDHEAFNSAIQKAALAAQNGSLVTFGIKPNGPETGYGYIRSGSELSSSEGVYKVDAFVEKPSRAVATAYLNEGNYLWNSGIFLFSSRTYLEELKRSDPDMLIGCETAFDKAQKDLTFCRLDTDSFSAVRSDSIDYAIMEKTKNAAIVPVDMGWSDLGAWSALYEIGNKDENNNVTRGDVYLHDAHNCYVRSQDGIVAVIGLHDVAIVATDDAILVSHLDRVQDVKLIVDRLKSDKRGEYQTHKTVHRPWGSSTSLFKSGHYQVKHLTIAPGETQSLQLHHHRAEHWIVISGMAEIEINGEVVILKENESTFISEGTRHRLSNPGRIPLHIVEVQSGSYLQEDDIVRFKDNYGRATQKVETN